METFDEWMYSELLEHLHKKEQEKDNSYYRPLELELPIMEAPSNNDGQRIEKEEENKDRGVIIIEL